MQMKTDAVPAGDGNAVLFESGDMDQAVMRQAVNSLMEKMNGGLICGNTEDGFRASILLKLA